MLLLINKLRLLLDYSPKIILYFRSGLTKKYVSFTKVLLVKKYKKCLTLVTSITKLCLYF